MKYTFRPECIINAGDLCGEGILWLEEESSLYWVDNRRNMIHRHDPGSGSIRTWKFGETVASIAATREPGTLCVVLGSRLLLWSPETDRRRAYGPPLMGYPEVRFNDSGVDINGLLWVGTMGNNLKTDGTKRPVPAGMGTISRVARGGGRVEIATDIGVANTLIWNPHDTCFYTADSSLNILRSYRYERDTATVHDPQPLLFDFPRGRPDGSAIDEEGSIWNCRYGGGCVVRVSPSGVIQQVVEMPARNVTSCAFGGRGLKTLYLTTAVSEENPKSCDGCIFAVDVGVAGKPLYRHDTGAS